MSIARSLSCLAAGALLASCVAHGAGGPGDVPRHGNYTSHDAPFFETLLADRVLIFHNPHIPKYRNVPHFGIYRSDGRYLECIGWWLKPGKLHWVENETGHWSFEPGMLSAILRYAYPQKEPGYSRLFYDTGTGATAAEVHHAHEDWRRSWLLHDVGWVQDSLPRSLADACPGLDLPAGMRINERQTSHRLDELRRQDPDAPIRHFPGSQHTMPGNTGLGASGGKPTTTKAEVEAYLAAQNGNIQISSTGTPYTYVRSGGREEFWRLGRGKVVDKYFDAVRSEDGNRISFGRYVYVFGWPFGYLPTGHRHPAFQITDELTRGAVEVALPFMGEAYADRRFMFFPDGNVSVLDLDGELAPGPNFAGTWRWTKGNLELTIRGDPGGPRSIYWRALAFDLGFQPKVWTRFTPNTP